MKNKSDCTDHKGIKYSSISAMCKAYNIDRATFNQRIKRGMSVKDALTIPLYALSARANKCIDHLGIEYPSEAKMCEKYNINFFTYRRRKEKGWSIKDCLTKALTNPNERFSKECVDHKGNKYNSESEMAQAWGIKPRTLAIRKNKGWTIEKALTTPLKDYSQKDHLGNIYPTLNAMCDAYGIVPSTFHRRFKKGWSLEKILTHREDFTCKDHTGTQYTSFDQMAKAWGISSNAIKDRIKRGFSLEEALTSKQILTSKQKYIDHKGNEYSSKKAMCKAYGVTSATYTNRIKKGMSIEEALTLQNPYAIKDHLGNCYNSIPEMANAYGINPNTLTSRLYKGMDVKTALLKDSREKRKNTEIRNEIIGTTRFMNCGLNATVIEYVNNQKMKIRFEDGFEKYGYARSFERGNICHSQLKNGKIFHEYKIGERFNSSESPYFEATDTKTNKKEILTPRQMLINKKVIK